MNAQDLKNSILQLAVQGRLVPQAPADEPASELLKRIRKEKDRLVAEGKIRNDQPLPTIGVEEIPFDIPETWQWVRLKDIVYNFGQKKPDKKFCYIDVGSINNSCGSLDHRNTIIEPDKAPSRARKIVQKGAVLYSCVRPYLLNICIVDRDFPHETIASTAFAVLMPFKGVLNTFLFHYLRSPAFVSYTNDVATGMAYPAINDESLYRGLVPIPPLAEQARIVAKIEELLPKVTEYGEAQERLTELNAEVPDQLRKSILQQAVQGKLTDRDPSNEPASALLERIRAEKAHLIEEGKIRREKPLLQISEDEIPFDIPGTWEWVRLYDVCEYIQRGKSPKYSIIKKYPVIAQKCIQWSGFSIEKAQFIDPASLSSYGAERFLQDGDLLWNSTGLGTLGRIAIYKSESNPYELAVADSHVTVIRVFKQHILPEYLYYYIANPSVQSVIEEQSSGSTKQKELATSTVQNYLFPLPPLAEQALIVERVKSLLTICDQLK